MAESKMTPPERVVERNLALTGEIMRYLIEKPQAFENLPENFELVVLPEGDSEMWLYNLHLMNKASQEGKPIVFAVLNTSKVSPRGEIPASLYAPVPV
jgi:hypothetical protein